jgi:hypothetical protein
MGDTIQQKLIKEIMQLREDIDQMKSESTDLRIRIRQKEAYLFDCIQKLDGTNAGK